MSFDIFLDCFKGGNFAKFPRAIAWEKFAPYAKGSFGHYDVCFPDGSGGYLGIDDDEEISGFGVNRPTGDMLYDVVFDIMRKTSTLLYWHERIAVVADEAVIREIPKEVLSAFGTPLIVHSGHEIISCIMRNDIPPTARHANDNDHASS